MEKWRRKKLKRLMVDVVDTLFGEEYPLPSLMREEMYQAGLDPDKYYPDWVYRKHGIDPDEVRSFRYTIFNKKRWK